MTAKTLKGMLTFLLGYDSPRYNIKETITQHDDLLRTDTPSLAYGIITDSLQKSIPGSEEGLLLPLAYEVFTQIFPDSLQVAVNNPVWRTRQPTAEEFAVLDELHRKSHNSIHNRSITCTNTTLPSTIVLNLSLIHI